jgi:hypothetical protein
MRKPWYELNTNPELRRRYRWIWRVLVGLVASVLICLFAFFTTFTTFVRWDDEGYFLLGYHDFLAGRVPYNQLFSVYGPFNFFSAALIARFSAANVTHDTFRWALLPVWIVIASLIGGLVWRWTGRFSLGVVALLLTGFRLGPLAEEIGHPQSWIILASALLLWIGLDWIYLPLRQRRAFWSGLIVGVILLCKINMGIYAFVAIALAVSLQLTGRIRLFAVGIAMTAAAGLGLLLLLSVSTRSEELFVFAYLGSLMATAAFAFTRPAVHRPSLTSLKWLLVGFGMCLGAGVGITLTWGTTIGALFLSLVIEPALLVKSYHLPFEAGTRIGSVVTSAVGIGSAFCLFFWRRRVEFRPAWLGQFKVAVGTGLLFLLAYHPPLALTGSLLFLWLLIVDTQPMTDADYSNRLLLAFLCPLFSLQLLPVAGEQVVWATLLQIGASAVLVADGINCVQREDLRTQVPRLTRLVAGGTGPIIAILFFLLVGRSTILRFHQWKGAVSLNLYGTHWLRVSPTEKTRLTVTVAELRNNCRTVLMIPGLYSFSLWSGVPAAEKRQIDSWPFYWATEVQRDELPKLRQQNQSCVLVSTEMYLFWRNMAITKGNDELVSEIRRTMTPIFELDDITLYRFSQKPDVPAASAAATGQR